MKLELRSKDNKLVCEMANDDVMLGSYPVEDNMIIHVSMVFVFNNPTAQHATMFEIKFTIENHLVI
jgi:hypothetical protein